MMFVLIGLEVFAIVANLVLPMARDLSLRGRATSIAREMEQVREASLQARATGSDWPPQPKPGAPPVEVETQLPQGFSFTHADYQLVWDRWTITDAAELGLQQTDLAGVTVIAKDPRLAELVACTLPSGRTRFTFGDRTTLVIDGAHP